MKAKNKPISRYQLNISRNIKYLQRTRGLTQAQFGDRLNVKENTVCQWESGNRTPALPKLIEIAESFNITLDEFIKSVLRY